MPVRESGGDRLARAGCGRPCGRLSGDGRGRWRDAGVAAGHHWAFRRADLHATTRSVVSRVRRRRQRRRRRRPAGDADTAPGDSTACRTA